jgi:hypothetical protein
MALNVKIDFENRYQVETIDSDLSSSLFTSILKDGTSVDLVIQICGNHPFLPDVLNLAFGPLDEDGEINDNIKLHHTDHSKAFSTIVFAGMNYLQANPSKSLGIDGSDNARAYMYYRCMQNNFDYLTQYFEIYGVNYYVRILRHIKDADLASLIDSQNIIALPQPISPTEQIPHEKLYNYIIFRLRNK